MAAHEGCETDIADAELVAAVRTGDQGAFEAIYRRHVGAAQRYAVRLAGPHQADDLVAEAFARLWAVLTDEDRDIRDFRRYLLVTIRNLNASEVRKQARLLLTEDVDQAVTLGGAAAGEQPLLAVVDPPETDLLREAERDEVAISLARLPLRWRQALWLTHVEGMSAADVGDRLGLSANATRQLSFRARVGLRREYLGQLDRASA